MSVSTDRASDILYARAIDLARRIANGDVSSREVVDAHIARIEEVDGKLNAVVARRFAEARGEADAVDAARRQGQPLGPLAGVPITIKECFFLKGTPATIGIQRYGKLVAAHDGVLVARLRRAGAIILGKTNVPQAMLLNETDNPVYGRTNNPWNLDRGPGGSTGGEAAIIAAGGSALGLGNDVGGSIRQPAHSCGICGLKPTSGRLTNRGSFENLRGMEAVGIQPGPLARSTDDVRLAYEILAAPSLSEVDWQIPPVAVHGPPISVEQLRVGYWTDDGYFPAASAVKRAVEEAAEALRASGATVERFGPPDVPRAMALYFALISADGGSDLKALFGDSPRDWRLRRLERLGGLPRRLRGPICGLLHLLGQEHVARLLRDTGLRGGAELWQLTYARREYVQQFVDRMTEAGLDCLLMPPHALPALTHGSTAWLNTAGSYAMLVNLLGCPAGVVPVTRVRADEEAWPENRADIALKTAAAVSRGSAGLPVGVQIVARHWREEVVLAVMKALESGLSVRPDYPGRPPI
jgi:fatty acid amide hydrolase